MLRNEKFFSCLQDALDSGAELVCGGHAMQLDGARDSSGIFLEPTVVLVRGLDGARDVRAVAHETFFPLLPVVVASRADGDDEELLEKFIDWVNSNEYGLRNSLWADDRSVIDRFTARVTKGGLLKVNDSHIGFLPYLPTHGGTGLTGGVFGEANYPILRTSHVQGVSVSVQGLRPREAVFGGGRPPRQHRPRRNTAADSPYPRIPEDPVPVRVAYPCMPRVPASPAFRTSTDPEEAMRSLDAAREICESYLPGLLKNLDDIPLADLEKPESPGLTHFRTAKGPGLVIPKEYQGAGADPLQALAVVRAIGAVSPSLAVATTMHHFSVATLFTLADSIKSSGMEWALLEGIAEQNLLVASGFAEGSPRRASSRRPCGRNGRRAGSSSTARRSRAASPGRWTS